MAKPEPQVPGEFKPEVEQPEAMVPASKLADLEAKFIQLSRQVQTAGKPQPRSNNDADLPNQNDIDVSKLKAPVLSRQGWVVPHTFGSQPNAPK
jgi:hypothetical protein